MTYVSNYISERTNKVEKMYIVTITLYDGDSETISIYATSAENAKIEASEMYDEIDSIFVAIAD